MLGVVGPECRTINFGTDSSFFYLPFKMRLHSDLSDNLHRAVCPAQAIDMIISYTHALTVATLTGISTISTSCHCVENAEPVGADPKVVCSVDGCWDRLVSL